MCTIKKKRVALNSDQWVIDEWKKRPKDETAQLLINANFDKARYWSCKMNRNKFPVLIVCFSFFGLLFWGSIICLEDKFVAELEIIIRKTSKQKIQVEEEWLSEKEMRDEYKWSTCLTSTVI